MSQQEILDFLKENPNKWFTTKTISNRAKLGRASTSYSLKRLRDAEDIKFKKTKVNIQWIVWFFEYKYKK